jgi:allantoinase
MLANSSGLPGLEALVPLLMKGLHEHGLPLTHMARLLAASPAALFRIGGTKGALEVGRDGDVVLMSKSAYRYDPAAAGANVVDWSPYAGMEMPYRVEAAYLRGEAVSVGGQVLAQPGNGRFVRPFAKAA